MASRSPPMPIPAGVHRIDASRDPRVTKRAAGDSAVWPVSGGRGWPGGHRRVLRAVQNEDDQVADLEDGLVGEKAPPGVGRAGLSSSGVACGPQVVAVTSVMAARVA